MNFGMDYGPTTYFLLLLLIKFFFGNFERLWKSNCIRISASWTLAVHKSPVRPPRECAYSNLWILLISLTKLWPPVACLLFIQHPRRISCRIFCEFSNLFFAKVPQRWRFRKCLHIQAAFRFINWDSYLGIISE